MAQSAMTVRVDSQAKLQFDQLCQEFGMSSNTAINIFIHQVIRKGAIPFTISVSDEDKKEAARKRVLAAFNKQREKVMRSTEPEILLEEINHEIDLVRQENKSNV